MSDKAKAGGDEAPAYEPFDGICLTDTFQMYESDDLIEQFFPDNSERRKRQKNLDIRVIVGNPPYSAGQESANDNNQNVAYSQLDERIRTTYAADSKATLKNALYDSYIRAIRWASDRVGKNGIVGFVTNAGFLEAATADGLRKRLAQEYSRIYVLHLRGNQRTQGEQSRREGGKIFGSGSRAPIAITLLVKTPQNSDRERPENADIRFHDVGDYLTRDQKLAKVEEFGSVAGLTLRESWVPITPDKHHDWLRQRDDSFEAFLAMGSKRGDTGTPIFRTYSAGLKTNRDFWAYNFARNAVAANMRRMVGFYHSEVERYAALSPHERTDLSIAEFINADPTKISWDQAQKSGVESGRKEEFTEAAIRKCIHRPYTGSWVYFDPFYNNRVYRLPDIFPDAESENRMIVVKQRWSGIGQFAVMVDRIIDVQTDGGTQCFPLYAYDEDATKGGLFDSQTGSRDFAIGDDGFREFQRAYPERDLTKEDLFYYIYGLLHSTEYRERYRDNLSKELPRIPAVRTFEGFQAFSQAGRELAHWHLDYETVDCHPATLDFTGGPDSLSEFKDEHFYVRMMKFPKDETPGAARNAKDKTSVIYNEYVTVSDIPLEAYDYVVNGKSAIEWVMKRQSVTTDRKSGIVNDANLWATETMNNAAYPLELLLRIITVSLETQKIVKTLPSLDIG